MERKEGFFETAGRVLKWSYVSVLIVQAVLMVVISDIGALNSWTGIVSLVLDYYMMFYIGYGVSHIRKNGAISWDMFNGIGKMAFSSKAKRPLKYCVLSVIFMALVIACVLTVYMSVIFLILAGSSSLDATATLALIAIVPFIIFSTKYSVKMSYAVYYGTEDRLASFEKSMKGYEWDFFWCYFPLINLIAMPVLITRYADNLDALERYEKIKPSPIIEARPIEEGKDDDGLQSL